MYSTLPELCEQLISLSKSLPVGDNLTLGWFSSEGNEFNWIFKGFRIVDKTDYKALEQAIRKNNSTIGCTCFSEILTDTAKVIADISVLSKVFSLSFMSDGYPVVSNYNKEISSIFSAIKAIKGKIQSSSIIGYGSFYNKELLSQMSEKLGSMLIHSSRVMEYAQNITRLIKLTENSEPKEEIEPLMQNAKCIFTVTDQGVVIYSIDEDGKIYVSPEKGKSTKVYYLTEEKPNKKSWDKIEIDSIDFGDNSNVLSKALYSAALVMSQQVKTDVAMEILGAIGDKAMIDKLDNAFQVEEYGTAEDKILQAIQDVGNRFEKGRDTKYLPAPDAFCAFDVLNTLIDDEDAAFFPYHEKFSYEKIGAVTKAKDGYAKFSPDKSSKCSFNTLTWHESRLNLSVQTTIKGTAELQPVDGVSPEDAGFTNPYPTFVYRNYAFVKDGHVHTKKFYITSSDDTYKLFKNKGIIIDDGFKKDGIFGIDLSTLPVINRAIADGKTSGTDLARMALAEHKLKALIKALKWLKDDLCVEKQVKSDILSDAQVVFLKENGILVERGGVYSPQTEKEEPNDWYMAKTFELKLSGIASLPPVKKVAEKIASGKARTPVEALIKAGISEWNVAKGKLKDSKKITEWFEKAIKDKQVALKAIRPVIQQTKFGVLLAKKWFEEFNSRDNCELMVEGVKVVFALGEEKVAY